MSLIDTRAQQNTTAYIYSALLGVDFTPTLEQTIINEFASPTAPEIERKKIKEFLGKLNPIATQLQAQNITANRTHSLFCCTSITGAVATVACVGFGAWIWNKTIYLAAVGAPVIGVISLVAACCFRRLRNRSIESYETYAEKNQEHLKESAGKTLTDKKETLQRNREHVDKRIAVLQALLCREFFTFLSLNDRSLTIVNELQSGSIHPSAITEHLWEKVHQQLKDYEAWKKSSRQSVTDSHTIEIV